MKMMLVHIVQEHAGTSYSDNTDIDPSNLVSINEEQDFPHNRSCSSSTSQQENINTLQEMFPNIADDVLGHALVVHAWERKVLCDALREFKLLDCLNLLLFVQYTYNLDLYKVQRSAMIFLEKEINQPLQ